MLKLPSFMIAMATGIFLWIYLLQQSTQIITEAQSQLQSRQELPKQKTNTSRKLGHRIKIVPHFEPKEHGKILEQRLDNALLENELKRQEFKFESVLETEKEIDKKPVEEYGYHYVPFMNSLKDIELKAVLKPSESICRDSGILVIAVSCSVESFHYRQAIRQTWGSAVKNTKLGVKVIFNIAQPAENWKHLEAKIQEEAETHQDILQWNFIDHHTNLTLKSVGLFQWIKNECSRSKFIMKTDDDVFINIPDLLQLLVRFIHDQQDSNMVLGYRIDNAKPGQDRNSKWYTSENIYRDRVYPTYLSGSAYVISTDIIGKLYDKALETPPFWLEDVYVTGILRAKLGVTLVHHEKFWYRHRKGGACEYKQVITGHELTEDELYKIWSDLHRPDLECKALTRGIGS